MAPDPRGTKARPQIAVISAYPPDRGRLSEYAHALLGAVSARGVRVRVGSDSPSDGAENVEVEKLWRPDDVLSVLRILAFVVRSRAGVVVFNTSFAVYGKSRVVNFMGFVAVFLAAQLGKVMGFKTVAIVHNIPEASDTARFGLPETVLNRTGVLLAERLLLSSRLVVVTLGLYKTMLERRFGRLVFHLPHGTWKDERGGNPEPKSKRLLFFGFLSPGKDMAMLRGIFDELKERHPDLQLRVVASPHPNIPRSTEVLQWFRGSPGIEVRGYVPETELVSAFDDCDAVVLPYGTSMGTSGVLHLANSFGVPAVTTDLPEFREMQSEGAGVIVCPTRGDMVESLDRLVSDREYWRGYSARAREYSSGVGWDAVAGRFLRKVGSA